jgi:hypothetical protein
MTVSLAPLAHEKSILAGENIGRRDLAGRRTEGDNLREYFALPKRL